MKINKHSFTKAVSIWPPSLAAAAILLLAAPLQAQPQRFDFPSDSPGIPAYARIDASVSVVGGLPRNEDWAAIVFYRNPDCVPLDFNLAEFFHFPGPDGSGGFQFGAFECELLTTGFELWNNPEIDPAPLYVRSRNVTANLPVWFVDSGEFAALIGTGAVFIEELDLLPSLIKGSARTFEESIYPHGGAVDPAITLSASGRLDNGGQFNIHWHFQSSFDEDLVRIDLELPDDAGPPGPPKLCDVHPLLPFC